jgi:hypothetical protein
MTLRSWIRQLFARPATRPTLARCRPTRQALEDCAPPTVTFKPAWGTAKPHPVCSGTRAHARASLVYLGRFSPLTVGFWLGGAGMGTGGCLLGALMPYHHPVAVALSVLWWGLYFGCFGASVGALVGVLTDRAPPRPPATRDGTGMVSMELGLDARAADAGSTAVCAPRGPRGLARHQRDRERPA